MADQETEVSEPTDGSEADDREEEGNEETDEEDKEPEDPPKPLTPEIIGDNLNLLCKTSSGLSHAYVKLDVKDKDLTEIKLLDQYIHLRYVDITKNLIRDVTPLNGLTNLLLLRADMNKLTSVGLEPLPYLQVASFTGNHLKNTEGLNHPMLEHLNLSYNQITQVSRLDAGMLHRLHTLELRGNQLTSTAGIALPNLKNLFLGANLISNLEGLESLENLTTLHLRDNQLTNLDGFTGQMKRLQYLNIRGNHITSLEELVKLKDLPNLRALVLSENPVADDEDYRLEVLVRIRGLQRLDKDEVTEEEGREAQATYQQRQEALEQEQQQEEQEDKQSQETEGQEEEEEKENDE